jgi:hypothetical protein
VDPRDRADPAAIRMQGAVDQVPPENPSQRLVKTRVVQADVKQVAAEQRCTHRQLSGAATTLRR